MIQEEKELLLKDLCARIPYNVKGCFVDECGAIPNDPYLRNISLTYTSLVTVNGRDGFVLRGEIKPYLLPLSSMTEDQKNEYYSIVNYISSDDTENWKEGEFIYIDQFSCLIHFYHINHLDYRGLIPKGLAIDATGLNIYK